MRKFIPKKGQIRKFSSCEVTQQIFLDQVKDQVRSGQKEMLNVADSGEEHSIIWRMFMAATMNATTFMGENFSTIQNFVKNYEDSHVESDVRCHRSVGRE